MPRCKKATFAHRAKVVFPCRDGKALRAPGALGAAFLHLLQRRL